MRRVGNVARNGAHGRELRQGPGRTRKRFRVSGVDGEVPPAARQLEGHSAPQPERGAGDHCMRHGPIVQLKVSLSSSESSDVTLAVPSLLTLYSACTPCTASRSHAAWDVDRHARCVSVLRQAQGAGRLERAPAAGSRRPRLAVAGLVQVAEVTEIVVRMAA